MNWFIITASSHVHKLRILQELQEEKSAWLISVTKPTLTKVDRAEIVVAANVIKQVLAGCFHLRCAPLWSVASAMSLKRKEVVHSLASSQQWGAASGRGRASAISNTTYVITADRQARVGCRRHVMYACSLLRLLSAPPRRRAAPRASHSPLTSLRRRLHHLNIT